MDMPAPTKPKQALSPPDRSRPGAASENIPQITEVNCVASDLGELSPIGMLCEGILTTLNGLPDCPEPAKAAVVARISGILAMFTENEGHVVVAKQKISALKSKLRSTTEQLAILRQEHFDKSSEKACAWMEEEDLSLELDDEEEEQKEEPKGKRDRKVGGNIKVVRVDHYPDEMACFTCGNELKSIKQEERVGMYRIIPEHVELIKNIYHTCACNRGHCKDNKPVLAKSNNFIMKGRGMEATSASEAACQKFFEHIPTFRMERRFINNNVNLSRQAIGRNIAHLAGFLEPVQNAILDHVKSGHTAHMDETPVRVLNPGTGKCDTGYFWVICRDERLWNPKAKPAVFYNYAHSRAGVIAEELLSDASLQFLQTDGYAGYNRIYNGNEISSARCWAHARRKFVETWVATKSPLARRSVQMIRKMYAVEKAAAGLPPEEREAMRQEHSLPILNALYSELQLNQENAQGGLRTAINYTLKAFDSLRQFIFNGKLEIDNNPVERCIRGIALTKKNALFAGSHDAAKVWAVYYTLIETARLNRINPRSYLNWVVDEIERSRGEIDYSMLMPWHCPTGHLLA